MSKVEHSKASSAGWRHERERVSLPEVHGSIKIPEGAGRWRKGLAFVGPGLLVAVGYMDPGNWATDLAGGSQFGYLLLSVVLLSNFMAMLLQHLSLKLGIATGRDLAQACRDSYSRPVAFVLWVLCEIAIAACDLAEVIGAAIALNLLFGLPLVVGVLLTAIDVLLILYLQHRGFRFIEAFVGALIGVIGLAFVYELVVSQPAWSGVLAGLVPMPEVVTNPRRALSGDWDSGRDSDAAQPVLALEHRADARHRPVRARQTLGDPLRHRSTRPLHSSSPFLSTPLSSSSPLRPFMARKTPE